MRTACGDGWSDETCKISPPPSKASMLPSFFVLQGLASFNPGIDDGNFAGRTHNFAVGV